MRPLHERLLDAIPAVRKSSDAATLWERMGKALEVEPEHALLACAETLGMQALSASALAEAPLADESQPPWAPNTVLVVLDGRKCLVIADPWDETLLARARRHFGPQLLIALALLSAIAAKRAQAVSSSVPLAAHAGNSALDGSIAKAAEQGDPSVHALDPAQFARERNPVLAFVDHTLHDAWSTGASDIHLETRRTGLRTRYRIDGVLVPGPDLGGVELARQAVSRVKVLAELDIAEQRVPQDGRIRLMVSGRAVDFRVSVMPSAHGEDIVLRILDKRQLAKLQEKLSLQALGFDAGQQETLRDLAERAHGMLLVTGPTGSGKTTTLYSLLSELATDDEKTVTIEDPIEYEIDGVLQIPVNEKKGLTFARGLRSILRHDPDRIMIGEIRDRETADIAVQAALTGHQVFATVHANSVFDVIGRFVHMNVDLYSLMSSLNGVVSQRLVRRLCAHCRRADEVTEAESRRARAAGITMPEQIFRPVGCAECRETGYRGRTAIVELIPLDDEFRDLVVRRASLADAKSRLAQRGLQTLAQAGLPLLSTGTTSFAEYWRAVATG